MMQIQKCTLKQEFSIKDISNQGQLRMENPETRDTERRQRQTARILLKKERQKKSATQQRR